MTPQTREEREYIANMLTTYNRQGRTLAYCLLRDMLNAADDGAGRADLKRMAEQEVMQVRCNA